MEPQSCELLCPPGLQKHHRPTQHHAWRESDTTSRRAPTPGLVHLLLLSCPSFLTTLTLPGCCLIPSSPVHNALYLFLGLASLSFSQAQLWLWTDPLVSDLCAWPVHGALPVMGLPRAAGPMPWLHLWLLTPVGLAKPFINSTGYFQLYILKLIWMEKGLFILLKFGKNWL